MVDNSAVVLVTGANGFVGYRVCEALASRGVSVRALVRRPGTAPGHEGVVEIVGDFTDPATAAAAVTGARSVVTTVHPLLADRETQQRVGVEGTIGFARAAAAAGVEWLVHISTAAVYHRSTSVGDVDESSELVNDNANDYSVSKRDLDLALGTVEGMTRVLLRPPAILGPGPSSIWNTLQPRTIRDDERARRVDPDASFPWVHIDDLAAVTADLATGTVAYSADPATGPVRDGCTALNVSASRATQRDYLGTVCAALGLTPDWADANSWTGGILAERAHTWGWSPQVDLPRALAEVRAGVVRA